MSGVMMNGRISDMDVHISRLRLPYITYKADYAAAPATHGFEESRNAVRATN